MRDGDNRINLWLHGPPFLTGKQKVPPHMSEPVDINVNEKAPPFRGAALLKARNLPFTHLTYPSSLVFDCFDTRCCSFNLVLSVHGCMLPRRNFPESYLLEGEKIPYQN